MAPDSDLLLYLESEYYTHLRELESGQVVGIQQMIFTVGVVYDLNWSGLGGRYCYPTLNDAIAAIIDLDDVYRIGHGTDPGGEWLVHKGRRGNLYRPGHEPIGYEEPP